MFLDRFYFGFSKGSFKLVYIIFSFSVALKTKLEPRKKPKMALWSILLKILI